MKLGITISPCRRIGPQGAVVAPPNEAETNTLVAAMSVAPSAARISLINSLIKTLKDNGIWAKLDIFYIFAAHDAQAARLNWKTPASFACTELNSPNFTVDAGYAGDGASARLTTNWDPRSHAVNWQLQSSAFGFWSVDSIDGSSQRVIGVDSAANNQSFIFAINSIFGFGSRNNQNGVGASYVGSFGRGGLGYTASFRANSSGHYGRRNKTAAGSVSQAVAASLTPDDFHVCGANTTNNNSTRRVSMAFAGGLLTDAESDVLVDAVDAYLSALGISPTQ